MQEVHDIAVLDDVLLALGAHPAFFTGSGIRASLQELVPADSLGSDELVAEIGVDGGSCLWCSAPALDGPGAGLGLPCREERDEIEQTVTGTDEIVDAVARDAELAAKLVALVIVDIRKLVLDACIDKDILRATLLEESLQVLPALAAFCIDIHCTALAIEHVEYRLHGHELQLFGDFQFLLLQRDRARSLALLQDRHDLAQHIALKNRILIPALAIALDALKSLLCALHVGERELQIDDVDVACRICLPRDVDDVLVVEHAHDFGDGIRLADVGEELVAETLAFGSALYEACDVDEFHGSRNGLYRVRHDAELREALIWHRHDADCRVDGGKRVIRDEDALLGECRKECRLPHIGEPDDADTQF